MRITFKDWYAQYRALKATKWATTTMSRVDNLYKNHLSDLDDMNLDEITLDQYQAFIDARVSGKLSYSYINTINKRMMSIVNSAVEHDIITSNKLKDVKINKRYDKRVKFFETEILKELDNIAKSQFNTLQYGMYVLLRIGWRRGEVLGLTKRAINIIDDNNVAVSVLETKVETSEISDPKTSASFRTNYLAGETAKAIISAFVESRQAYETLGLAFDDNSRIFINTKRSKTQSKAMTYSTSYPATMLKLLQNEINERVWPGRFRHSFATHAIASGINIVEVSKWIGHANVNMTLNVYTHATRKTQEELTNFADFNKET